ncbi:hypothetical protein FBZ33_2590 [Micromonospora sp. A202]|nr:hypothetical protein FBZ33_2590 [Micromonospora sp. A202]
MFAALRENAKPGATSARPNRPSGTLQAVVATLGYGSEVPVSAYRRRVVGRLLTMDAGSGTGSGGRQGVRLSW